MEELIAPPRKLTAYTFIEWRAVPSGGNSRCRAAMDCTSEATWFLITKYGHDGKMATPFCEFHFWLENHNVEKWYE